MLLTRVSTLATSDTKRTLSLKIRQQPSRIPTNAGLERPSGRKKTTQILQEVVQLVPSGSGVGRSWVPVEPQRPPRTTHRWLQTPAITTGASAGTESPRSHHGHRPPRRGKTARAGPARAEAPSATAGPPRRSTRRAHGRRGPPAPHLRGQRDAGSPGRAAAGPQAWLQRPCLPSLHHRASSRSGRPRSPYPPGLRTKSARF